MKASVRSFGTKTKPPKDLGSQKKILNFKIKQKRILLNQLLGKAIIIFYQITILNQRVKKNHLNKINEYKMSPLKKILILILIRHGVLTKLKKLNLKLKFKHNR